MESLLIKSANGESYVDEFKIVQGSVFQKDINFDRFEIQLSILEDVVHEALPAVKKVTRIHTICEELKMCAYRTLLSQVHKLLLF